ncbi:MAG: sensor histidine kinase [Microcystaceae cyanobacterium]
MFQTTRRRLALWYTIITAILLLLFATGIYFYVRSTLIDRIDDTLKHVVEVINRSLVIESITDNNRPQINIDATFRPNVNAVEDDHIDLEWFNPQGERIWSTFSDAPVIPLNPNRNATTVRLSFDYLLRQVTERIEINHQVLGYLRVSHPWFEVTKPTRRLIVDLTAGISLMLACVAAIGWFLSGIAIQPVKDSYQSLRQFTADASHELRNPIAMIQTNVQRALTYPDTSPELQKKQLQVIERLTKRLGNLVNDLLFLARSDSGTLQIDFQEIPIDALLLEVIEEQRIFAEEKKIKLSFEVLDPQNESLKEPFTIKGDWNQLARLFTNLISNALTYTNVSSINPNPKVDVILQIFELDRYAHLKVQIKDNGIGIPEEEIDRLFDRFYRIDPARQHQYESSLTGGSGLGLAIAAAIAENHRGKIKLESILYKGTTVTVFLPLD